MLVDSVLMKFVDAKNSGFTIQGNCSCSFNFLSWKCCLELDLTKSEHKLLQGYTDSVTVYGIVPTLLVLFVTVNELKHE